MAASCCGDTYLLQQQENWIELMFGLMELNATLLCTATEVHLLTKPGPEKYNHSCSGIVYTDTYVFEWTIHTPDFFFPIEEIWAYKAKCTP